MTELRALAKDDIPAVKRLMSHAFGRGQLPDLSAYDESDPPPSWGIFDHGALMASATVVPFEVHWSDAAILKLGGIAGVATFAQARGRGYVDQLLRETLRAMRGAGQVVSALFPFSFAYYRKFGWEGVGQKREVTLPLRELRRHADTRVDALADDGAAEALIPIYTQVARNYRGAFTAQSHSFSGKLAHNDGRQTYVYVHRDRVGAIDGYLLWRYNASGDGPVRVREYIAATPEADRALLTLLRDLGMQVERARLTLPEDHPIACHLMHWDVETRVEPVFMGRVVDVAAALAALPVRPELPDGRMSVRVQDSAAPWNEGAFRIETSGGKVAATPIVGDTDAGVTLEITAFSQAFWGSPDLHLLRRAGRVSVADEADFTLLSAILPPAAVMCWNDF